jgi:hypothetical protein
MFKFLKFHNLVSGKLYALSITLYINDLKEHAYPDIRPLGYPMLSGVWSSSCF